METWIKKKYIIVSLDDFTNILHERKMHLMAEVCQDNTVTTKMFFDTYEEAEQELLKFNGINAMHSIMPVYSSSFDSFKQRFKVR